MSDWRKSMLQRSFYFEQSLPGGGCSFLEFVLAAGDDVPDQVMIRLNGSQYSGQFNVSLGQLEKLASELSMFREAIARRDAK